MWVVWGSTYLAIRWAVETLPPFLMAGVRFLVAGALIGAWALSRGEVWPRAVHWRSALVIGTLLLLGGNGVVVWSEHRGVTSGLASLLVATTPLWMVLLDSLRPRGTWARPAEAVGVVVGFAGVLLLLRPGEAASGVPLSAALLCMLAPMLWSAGSIFARHAPLPASPFTATAMEMLCGGAVLLGVATLAGEWGRVDPAAWSVRSLLAFAYLTTFGSVVGFTSYIYLLKHTTPAKATTYAYVNPAVAVFLGWLLADEALTGPMLVAIGIILAGVVITVSFRAQTPGEDLEVPLEAPGAETGETQAPAEAPAPEARP